MSAQHAAGPYLRFVPRDHPPYAFVRRALIFAPYFLPRRRVGSMRPFRFAIHLRDFGWEPVVLTIAARGQELTEKEARLLDGIETHTVVPPFDRSVKAESQLGAQAARKRRSGPSLLDWIDRHMPVDSWMPLFLLKSRQIRRIVQSVGPDVLWSTGDPWSGLVMGERIASRFDLPWVADFRDPWTLCEVRTDGPSQATRAIDQRIESRVLRRADAVLFQATQTEKKYAAAHPALAGKMTTIYNSFDPFVFDDPVDFGSTPALGVGTGDELHLGFFGRFRAMSPATQIIDILAEARNRHGADAHRIFVHSSGPLNDNDRAYADSLGVADAFKPLDAVPLEKALSLLRRFDLLLVSTDERRDEIIPAKLLEYLATGRPIISLSRNPEVGRILAETGTGHQYAEGSDEEIADMLVGCLREKSNAGPLPFPFRPVRETILDFEARHTTAQLADLFDQVHAARRSRSTANER
jgi:glycosyltransferase involved in cell wall biosynthesis